MKTDLPCAIVRDLLPSYAEGLTEEETTAAVKAHLDTCPDCAKRYETIAGGEEPTTEAKEVDYLKTVRKKSRKKVVIAVLLAVIVVLGMVSARFFFIGWVCDGSTLAVTPTVSADGEVLHLELLNTNSATTILGYTLQTDENGIASITAREALVSPFRNPADPSTMELPLEGVTRVEVCGTTIWQEGVPIDYHTSRLMALKALYVGDNSAIGALVSAMDLDAPASIALQTSAHPYGITLRFTEAIDENRRFIIKGNAYLLLALVDNLEEVRWSWPQADGDMGIIQSLTLKTADLQLPELVRTYNETHGTALVPLDSVKDYGADAASLQILRNLLAI